MCPTISSDFPAVRLTGVPARFTTVPVDQYSRAPPAITLHVHILSSILKHEMLFQCYGLAETLPEESFPLLSRAAWEERSHVCALYMKRFVALRLEAQRGKKWRLPTLLILVSWTHCVFTCPSSVTFGLQRNSVARTIISLLFLS